MNSETVLLALFLASVVTVLVTKQRGENMSVIADLSAAVAKVEASTAKLENDNQNQTKEIADLKAQLAQAQSDSATLQALVDRLNAIGGQAPVAGGQ
jgi:septal ring factor EnvC (AmiA/AmiB activator)